ncbi:MAG: chloride channel protein [Desulfatitalea sp.]|nr:chloride channel protein [Desulfatitalea sp.]NNK00273.1 chloride channel protein [Desulfatitalea sp.]
MKHSKYIQAVQTKWAIIRSDDRLIVIAMAGLVGACSGLAAVALNRTLHYLSDMFQQVHHHWWAFAIPAVGASFSAIFLNHVLHERAGHGVPEVVYAVSRHGGLLRFRSSFSRLVSSCLTIGSGGSAGPEAPVVISGAALGSNIARMFALRERQRIVLVGCGAAGAIASIFNAPITGLVFTVEVILGQWQAFNVIPIAIAAVAGTEVSRLLQGNQIAFAHQQHFVVNIVDIAASFGVVFVATVVSVLLGRLLNGMHHVAERTPLPGWVRPAVGGAAVGIIGLQLPLVQGEGYHAILEMIQGSFHPGILLAAVAIGAKMVATALTLGWGGSGGIFAPSLMIGGLVGLFYHRALTWLIPSAALSNEGCFALLGMAGLVGGILQAPLTAIFLVVEITGGYAVILPLIIVSALTSTFCYYIEPGSFYLRELIEKGQYMPPGTDARILSDLTVGELVETGHAHVPGDTLLSEFIEILQYSNQHVFPVVARDTSRYLGLVLIHRIRPYLFDRQMRGMLFVEQIMEHDVPTVKSDDELSHVLEVMEDQGLDALPVVEHDQFIGMVSKATLLDRYRKELIVQAGM